MSTVCTEESSCLICIQYCFDIFTVEVWDLLQVQHTVVCVRLQVELLSKGSINPQFCKMNAPPNKLYISWYYF